MPPKSPKSAPESAPPVPATADDIVALLGELRRSNAVLEANQKAIEAVLSGTATKAATSTTAAPASAPTSKPTEHGEHTPARAEHYDLLRSEKPIVEFLSKNRLEPYDRDIDYQITELSDLFLAPMMTETATGYPEIPSSTSGL